MANERGHGGRQFNSEKLDGEKSVVLTVATKQKTILAMHQITLLDQDEV